MTLREVWAYIQTANDAAEREGVDEWYDGDEEG
jgi:hypothetical protein